MPGAGGYTPDLTVLVWGEGFSYSFYSKVWNLLLTRSMPLSPPFRDNSSGQLNHQVRGPSSQEDRDRSALNYAKEVGGIIILYMRSCTPPSSRIPHPYHRFLQTALRFCWVCLFSRILIQKHNFSSFNFFYFSLKPNCLWTNSLVD